MLKFIKLVGWFKSHWKLLAGIATILITVYAGIQTARVSKLVKGHHELKGKLTEQRADQDKLYAEGAKERKEHALERAKARLERERLEASIKKARDEGLVAKRALEREKKKTAKLPPTELVVQLNERVGPEEVTLATGDLYLFTRVGANRTLDRFKNGEFHLTEYNRLGKALEDHDLEVASFNTSIEQCEKTAADNLIGWDDCRETLATAMQDIKTLEKVKKSVVWKGRVQGGVIAMALFGITKILGVW